MLEHGLTLDLCDVIRPESLLLDTVTKLLVRLVEVKSCLVFEEEVPDLINSEGQDVLCLDELVARRQRDVPHVLQHLLHSHVVVFVLNIRRKDLVVRVRLLEVSGPRGALIILLDLHDWT